MSSKLALIIANTEYTDPGLAQLTAPGKDAKDFGKTLDSPELCAFDDVLVLVNETSHKVGEAIDHFLSNRRPDDLVILYFSGHGIRDEYGSLYLAVKNTNRNRLRSTAIKSDFIREAMDQSRSRRQVLILDCCNSGAFTQGTKAATGTSIGTASAFEAGYGRIVLTASDSTQYAWEGDRVIGETDNSLFTHFLVEGLEGRADLNSDGQITVDELYEYAYEKVKVATPKQTPSKFSSKQQGEIILRENIRIEDIKAAPLPPELINAIENPLPFVREGAIRQLEAMLSGKNRGMARTAREALERLAESDDSRQVAHTAMQALEAIRHAEGLPTEIPDKGITSREPEEVRPLGAQNVQEQFAYKKIESETKAATEPSESSTYEASLPAGNIIIWITLGWAISGMFAGFLWSQFDGVGGWFIGGIVGGGGGGFIMALILRYGKISSEQISTIRCVLVWALAGALGWGIGWELFGEPIGAGAGMAIFAIAGLVGTLGLEYLRTYWQRSAVIILAWFIGGAIIWFISRTILIETLYMDDQSTMWAIGTGIGWAMAGFVMSWQLLKDRDRIKQ